MTCSEPSPENEIQVSKPEAITVGELQRRIGIRLPGTLHLASTILLVDFGSSNVRTPDETMGSASQKLLEALKDFSPSVDALEELRKDELRVKQQQKRERSFWKKKSKIFN